MTDFRVPVDPKGGIDIDSMDQAEVSKLFEPELDMLHSKNLREEGPSTRERERFERECEQWRQALKVRLRENLRSHGISVEKVTFNSVDAIFRIKAHDGKAAHRDYSAEIQLASALAIAESHERGPFAAVVEEVTRAILAARDHYLSRMQ